MRFFCGKWKEYVSESGERGISRKYWEEITGVDDVKNHMEEIRIYMRGHNLYDIFYGRQNRTGELL